MPVVLDPPGITYGSGNPGVPVPGSGRAVPTSILNTVYEINGLRINNRRDYEHYWIRSFDGLYDSEVRDNREVNPDRDGETYYGGLYSGKPLVMEGVIRAHTLEKMLDMEYALTEAFDDISREFAVIGRTGDWERDWVVYAAKVGSLGLKDEQTDWNFSRAFMIQLRASKPNIFGLRQRYESTLLSESDTLTISHPGNRKAQLRLVIHGRQDDFLISNNITGQTFAFKPGRSVPADAEWEINFDEGTIFDQEGVNQFDAYDHASDWMHLAPNAEQKLTVQSTNRDASAAVTAYWQDTYK